MIERVRNFIRDWTDDHPMTVGVTAVVLVLLVAVLLLDATK